MNERASLIARLFGYAGSEGQLVTPPEFPGFTPTPISRVSSLFRRVAPEDYNPFESDPVQDIGGAAEPELGPSRLAGQGRPIGAPSAAVPASRLYIGRPHRHRHATRQGVPPRG